MSTVTISVSPEVWTVLYTGPTDSPIAVEKVTGGGHAFLGIDSVTPTNVWGHTIKENELINVELNDGELLYAKVVSSSESNIFAVTD
ncbi:hypothetical protein [Klebsiella michiganensis]|uniref:hypothetical protein n=1 Tax=Klebsiella michiganensis TaxID=1134687 RepID=UPI001CC975A9|nr:hypothetical protein [Klebsiella michiganensis]MBZ7392401.1 hypothetical protein [Klebsiella michiganensis]MDL4446315.1 hypothetical protein [Klebsiella michiganensis]MDL4490889.1 hypothetical protein [Klebsiella michiganensis]MDL4659632.1 hypothetical protein [Klebsiella michiganensis]